MTAAIASAPSAASHTDPAEPAVQSTRPLLSAVAVQEFAFGIETALAVALAQRGETLPRLTLERRLGAYSPRVQAAAKVRRYA